MTIPWVEKYRPSSLVGVVSHHHIITTLTNLIKSNRFPHVIFYGPSGTGKTTTILACAREIYGTEISSMILELNGSDDRGINIVREQIKEFSSTSNFSSNKLKLVILDEADSMTYDAQFALRQVIENYTNNTRFCFICNYITKIIPGIQSRCVSFNFPPINDIAHKKHLLDITQKEKMTMTEECIEEIIRISEGDMRRSINVLQAMYLSKTNNNDINDLYQIIGYPNPTIKQSIIQTILNNNTSNTYFKLKEIIKNNNLCVNDILKEIIDFIIHTSITPPKTARILSGLSKIETYISNNIDEDIQLGAIIGTIKLHYKTT